ncbi:helix-turn-helix transcriptional regulator [Shimazuella sp. AN120528]|uniref:helix-turn-helix domain-containing protein n=1 Tax=Shimazuella soli TaxID=1892854 RepID=UPI001F0EF19B|nr:helix-turn-helix transcriptional regulator [Shimazuella soli]MCH5585991.1 helix-turn-helix transcriptional regulator [Shimazuella soli]
MKTHLYVTAELASEIREARKKKGYRQEDLTLEGFLSTGTISRMERGSVSVSREKVIFLCEQLGVEIQKYQTEADEADEVDIALKLLSIENHLNMVSPDEAWEELRKIKPESEYHRIWALYLKARYWECKGKKEKAKVVYQQVVENDDPELRKYNFIPASYHALGRISFYEDCADKAMEFAAKGLDSFYKEGEKQHIYHYLLISKVIYLEELKRYEEALLEIEDLWANRNNIDSRQVILSMYEIKTRLLTKLSRFEQAVTLATEGLIMARINRMYDHASYLWVALGECYQQQNEIQNAEVCFQSAIKMGSHMENKFFVPKIFIQMGKLYQHVNASQKAYEMFTTAIYKSKEISNKIVLAESLECVGDYYIQYEKIEKARKVYEESLENYKRLGKQGNIRNLLLKIASCYRDSNRTKYYELLDEYHQIYSENRR